jgi:hypothetical protein
MYFSWYLFEGIKNVELRIMNVALRAFFSCPCSGLRRNDKNHFVIFVKGGSVNWKDGTLILITNY